ncbi:MAG: hypothetical protein HKN32_06150 [Flavobacteriales bacterium]|nr:hypothetical protein [Flavobacteriales bacterium]
MENEVNEMQLEFNDQLTKRVREYLDQYASENDIDLVLNDAQIGSTVLYSQDALDITQQVIEGLNEAYAAETSANEEE